MNQPATILPLTSKRKITTEKAVQVLASNGLQVSRQEAAAILDFLYRLAKTTTANENSIPVHKS